MNQTEFQAYLEANSAAKLRDVVSDMLYEEIISLHIAPGSKLNVNSIASSLGISRTPVAEAINTLTERELRVIELRYGQNCNLEKAGERFGITRERVRQIEAKALYKLKRNLGKMMAVSYEEYSLACQEKEEAVKKLKALQTRTQLSDSLPEQPEKAEIPIEDLDLSARAYNALRRADVKTVGEITKKFEDGTIVQCRNLGLTSIKEICKKLTSIGVSVKYI